MWSTDCFNHRSVQRVSTDKEIFVKFFLIAHCYNTLHIHCTIILLYPRLSYRKKKEKKNNSSIKHSVVHGKDFGIKHGGSP